MLKSYVAILLCLTVATPSLAGLDGTVINAGKYWPDTNTLSDVWAFSPSSFIVGDGVETISELTPDPGLRYLHDLNDLNLSIIGEFNRGVISHTFQPSEFNGFIYEGVGFGGIDSISVLDTTTVVGFDLSHVSLNGNRLLLDFSGLRVDKGQRVDLAFTERSVSPGVPEPATWLNMLAGISLVGVAIRRRKAIHLLPFSG